MDPWVVLRRLKQIMDCKIACMPPYIFKGNKTGPGRPTEAIGQGYDQLGSLPYDPNNISNKATRQTDMKHKIEQAHQIELDMDNIMRLNRELDTKSKSISQKKDKDEEEAKKIAEEKKKASMLTGHDIFSAKHDDDKKDDKHDDKPKDAVDPLVPTKDAPVDDKTVKKDEPKVDTPQVKP